MAAKKLVSVLDSRWKKRRPTKYMSKGRKLKSGLKMIFNYMKSDAYMFAPLIHPQSSLPSPPISSGEASWKPMKKKETKLVEDVNEYLKCDSYMYAPLAMMDSAYDGTTSPSSETAMEDDEHTLTRRIVVERSSLLQSERVKHVLNQNSRSLSPTEIAGKMLQQKIKSHVEYCGGVRTHVIMLCTNGLNLGRLRF